MQDGQTKEIDMAGQNAAASSIDLAKSWASGAAAATEETSTGADDLLNISAGEVEEQTGPTDEELYPSAVTEDSETSEEEQTSDGNKKVAAAKSGNKDVKGQASGTKERIPVKSADGSKGKSFIEVDYSDKEAIKKAHLLAHGARQWQVAKDAADRKFSTLDTEHKQLKGNWDALEGAYKGKGIEGVIDLLEGQQGAYKSHINQQIKRAEFLRNASPEEKQALEAKEEAQKHARELETIREENKRFREQMEQERETAELRSLESRIHPNFEKYRFKGRLGDPNDEHMFDEMLWGTALKKLEPYEEKGLEITPEMIEGAFRSVAQALRKRVTGYGEKVAARSVEKKKAAATEQVQSKVMSGYRGNETTQEAHDLIRKGDIAGVFKQWGKLSSAFGAGKK
jgi:hypothetical protein